MVRQSPNLIFEHLYYWARSDHYKLVFQSVRSTVSYSFLNVLGSTDPSQSVGLPAQLLRQPRHAPNPGRQGPGNTDNPGRNF